MQGIVGLDTIAELSLALAGFSALLAVFRGGAIHTWHPRARLGFWLIITWSLGALFFSLLPSLLIDLGVTSWAAPISTLALFLIVATASALRQNLKLVADGFPATTQLTWVLGTLIGFGTVGVLAYGVAGGLGGPTHRLYHFGVGVSLLLACVSFVAVLRLREPAA